MQTTMSSTAKIKKGDYVRLSEAGRSLFSRSPKVPRAGWIGVCVGYNEDSWDVVRIVWAHRSTSSVVSYHTDFLDKVRMGWREYGHVSGPVVQFSTEQKRVLVGKMVDGVLAKLEGKR